MSTDVPTELHRELTRARRRRDRYARAATVVFSRICRGLYISHEHGMSLWHRGIERKWELTFYPSKYTKKFNSFKEARAYANVNALIARG